MSDTNDEIFILTTDTIQGYEGEIVRFPDPVGAWARYSSYKESYKAVCKAMRDNARGKGANAIIGVRFDFDLQNGYSLLHATGTAVYLDSPLPAPQEIIRNLEDSRSLREL